jgi:hypothetical protein
LAQGLAAVAARLEPQEAARICAQAAATLSQALAKTTNRELARGLAALAAYMEPEDAARFVAIFTQVMAQTTESSLVGRALKPLGSRMSTPQLVELLKYPTCVGSARRAILDELENRYQQKFAHHWAFVHFAEEQKLGLDFTTPPQRPGLPVAVKGNNQQVPKERTPRRPKG